MPAYLFRGEAPRTYPEPPIARELTPGDLVELEADQLPDDGRFMPAPDTTPKSSKPATSKGEDA